MELTYDWSNFRATFASSPAPSLPGAPPALATKLVSVNGKIAAITGHFQPVSGGWIGKSVEAFKRAHPQQEIKVFESDTIDQWVSQSVGSDSNHMYEQVMRIHSQAGLSAESHFLLKAFEANWAKVLPSSFGVLIRLSDVAPDSPDAQARDFFVVVKQGKLALFHRPELTSMGPTRSDDLAEVVKYLSEKHSVPIQALQISKAEWSELGRGDQPWKDLASLIKAKRADLVPFRWPVLAWVATRALFKS